MLKMKKYWNKRKQRKGITLVSLVITIIIIIILSTVTISTTFGENGLISQAQFARDLSANATIAEQEEMNNLLEEYSGVMGNNTGDGNIEGGDITLDALISRINELTTEVGNMKTQIAELENNTKTIDDIYPIGSIYISTELSTAEEVSNKLGGTWESYGQGRTLVGVGTGTDSNSTSQAFNINETGGEYNHTLTVAEMPSHSHAFSRTVMSWPIDSVPGWGFYDGNWAETAIPHMVGVKNTNATGGSQAHNNIQPYITVYMWKRTS